jgi:hypothetical protein
MATEVIETNPIGEAQKVNEIEQQIQILATKWQEENPTPHWWQFYKKNTALYKVAKFLINALDELILAVDKYIESGPDKKATVMNAIGLLYDYIIREALPIWAKPFAGKIRSLIIDILIATAIDWIVGKYREGSWQDKPAEETNGEKNPSTVPAT